MPLTARSVENLSFNKQVRYKPNIKLYINNKNYCVEVYRAVRVEIRWCKVMNMPVPMAARYKAWVCGRSLVGIVSSNPAAGMDVCVCECCVSSGRDHCVGLITRPEESYKV